MIKYISLLIIPILCMSENLYTQLAHKHIYLEGETQDKSGSANYDKFIVNTVGNFIHEDTSLNYDVELYSFSSIPKPHRSISISYSEEQKSGYQINSLYAKQNIGDFSTYVGVMPFRGGRFSEMKDPLTNGGNSMPIISSQNLLSIFQTYKTDDIDIIVGIGKVDEFTNFRGLEDSNKDTHGKFLLIKKESDKQLIELDAFEVDVQMRGFDYSRLRLLALGYLYDDSLDSGLSAFVNVSMSNNKENIEDYIASQNTPNYIRDYMGTLGYTVTNQNNTGYALLLGAKYDMSIYNYDAFIGAEYFKTKDGYVSMNHGTLFLSDHSFWQNRDSSEHIIYTGIEINNHFTILGQYSWGESNKVATGFSISNLTSDTSGLYGFDSFQKFMKFQMTMNYRF